MKVTGDVGPEVLQFLLDGLSIDPAWALREPRSFTWWAHRLAQRVWAEPVRLQLGLRHRPRPCRYCAAS